MIAIVDYGGGNLRSVEMALLAAGANARLTSDPGEILAAAAAVSPGQGAFGDVMRSLERRGLLGPVRDRAAEAMRGGRPFLGICVGMQLLSERGLEFSETPGLGWIKGEVRAIEPKDPSLKIPHMGWNTLNVVNAHALLDGIPTGPDGWHAYFVHSFALAPKERRVVVAETDYGGPITALVADANIAGTQFHPEKSQKLGLKLIANFLSWKP